jgi:hypothetical protein
MHQNSLTNLYNFNFILNFMGYYFMHLFNNQSVMGGYRNFISKPQSCLFGFVACLWAINSNVKFQKKEKSPNSNQFYLY